ncbi:hypothetical protein BJ085DRAFT_37204, partial [Dimargaris cristalligena]
MPLTIKERNDRFEPAELGENLDQLHQDDHQALDHLIQASRLIDTLYFRQAWSGNEALRTELQAKAGQSDEDAGRYLCFDLNRGPWDRTSDHEPFIAG